VDRLDAEELSFYERVREGYLEEARRAPERILMVDSRGSREQTESQVLTIMEDLLAGAP
jgi:dTMP kinase